MNGIVRTPKIGFCKMKGVDYYEQEQLTVIFEHTEKILGAY